MTQILFQSETGGYNKNQVNAYINKLTEAYQSAYDENQALISKYNDLLEELLSIENKESTKMNSQFVAKTIVDTEVLAKSIIDDAFAQAECIKAEAIQFLTNAEARAAEIDVEAKRAADDIYTRLVNANTEAGKILDEAATDAARITEYAENKLIETQEIIDRTIGSLQHLLFDNQRRSES